MKQPQHQNSGSAFADSSSTLPGGVGSGSMDKTSSSHNGSGGNQLYNGAGDVSDNNNSVAYQTSLNSSNPMINDKDASKTSDCTETSATSGMYGIQSDVLALDILVNHR